MNWFLVWVVILWLIAKVKASRLVYVLFFCLSMILVYPFTIAAMLFLALQYVGNRSGSYLVAGNAQWSKSTCDGVQIVAAFLAAIVFSGFLMVLVPAFAPEPLPSAPAIGTSKFDKQIDTKYSELRANVFNWQEELASRAKPNDQTIAVLMEFGESDGVVSVVSVSDGSVSVYMSDGSAYLNMGSYPNIRVAASALVATARGSMKGVPIAFSHRPPRRSHATVYFLMADGIRGVEVERDDVLNPDRPLSLLFRNGLTLWSEVRDAMSRTDGASRGRTTTK